MSPFKARLARAGAALVLGLGLAVAATTGTSAASAPHYAGNSPTHDWGGYTCADDARTVAQQDVRTAAGTLVATVELKYSSRCDAHWAEVDRHIALVAHHWFSAAVVHADGSDVYCQYAEPDGFTGGGCYTAMLTSLCELTSVWAKGIWFDGSNRTIVAFGQTRTNPAGGLCGAGGAGVGGR